MDIDMPTVRDFNLDRRGNRGQSTLFYRADWTGKYFELNKVPNINIVRTSNATDQQTTRVTFIGYLLDMNP